MHISIAALTQCSLDVVKLGVERPQVLYMNDFWLMRSRIQPLNRTREKLTLAVSYRPISIIKWQMQAQMEGTCHQGRCAPRK